jgi:hypothetical protein
MCKPTHLPSSYLFFLPIYLPTYIWDHWLRRWNRILNSFEVHPQLSNNNNRHPSIHPSGGWCARGCWWSPWPVPRNGALYSAGCGGRTLNYNPGSLCGHQCTRPVFCHRQWHERPEEVGWNLVAGLVHGPLDMHVCVCVCVITGSKRRHNV